MAALAQIATANGFELISTDEVTEIEGTAHLMSHRVSGARLLYLQNDDDNKAFSIAFKTPAADNTGVFHILEHSVLCGSKRFPVKEPFVNLLKNSMQTFLNAMTFPDKTMYPVASTNQQDLLNLATVYLDAVFQPAIYDKQTIFEQEGWHVEVAGENPLELVYNGVVYNEMKGALSDPDSVLFNAVSSALFPDTTYQYESGGAPEAIPTLTYEAFLDTHARHYRPDNAYIVLYGNVDVEAFLQLLNDDYLTPLAPKKDAPLNINPLALQSEVITTGVRCEMNTTPENASCALGFVVGNARERERIIAAGILLDALMGSNEAPLKRAILDAQLASDALGYVVDGIYQPFAFLQLKGLNTSASNDIPAAFSRIVRETLENLAQGALDRELVSAALAHTEFVMREHDFGYADGVTNAITALSGWLYDDELAFSYLRFEDVLESLKDKLNQGYFEHLIEELFLNSNHFAQVELIPVPNPLPDVSLQALAARAQNLTSAEIADIETRVAALRAVQEAPDAPAALAKLPGLGVADIGDAPTEGEFFLQENAPLTCIRHTTPTRGIVYATRYYGAQALSFDELPYATVLAMVLSHLNTAHRSARTLDVAIQAELGSLTFFCEVHENVNDCNTVLPKFVVTASALEEKVEAAAQLVDEILYTTCFNDKAKVLDILLQKRIAMEQDFVTAGNALALSRVASYYTFAGVIRQQLSGIDFYLFLRDLIDNFDERFAMLCKKLKSISERLFTDANCILSFTGCDDALSSYNSTCKALRAESDYRVATGETSPAQLAIPQPSPACEAFVIPSDVSFTATGFNLGALDVPSVYSGAWLLASRVLSLDYLWNEVRVKGGAYGCGFQVQRAGSARFYSYRDPHVDSTIARFAEAGTWLATFEPTSSEMVGYIVSTTAAIDTPLKPRALARKQDGMFFADLTRDDVLRTRQEVIASRPCVIQALAGAVSQLVDTTRVCTVGPRTLIEASATPFEVRDILG